MECSVCNCSINEFTAASMGSFINLVAFPSTYFFISSKTSLSKSVELEGWGACGLGLTGGGSGGWGVVGEAASIAAADFCFLIIRKREITLYRERMASSGYGNGYATITPSNVIKQRTNRDPNWELNEISTEQTTIFTETPPSRILTAVGYIQPTFLSQTGKTNATEAGFWGDVNEREGTVTFSFYFEDIDLQRCYGLQVESLWLNGIKSTKDPKILRSATSELCADCIDDELTTEVGYYSFSPAASRVGVLPGKLVFREASNPSNIHTLHLFSEYGGDNGYYTFFEFAELVRDKLKVKLEALYGGVHTIPVEVYINSRGRFVLTWELPPALKAIVGHLQIDMNPENSTLLNLVERYFIFERFRRDEYTYDTVTQGDGVEFLRSLATRAIGGGGGGGGNAVGTAVANTPVVVALSPELSQFEKDDCITPLAATGEVCTFFPSVIGDINTRPFMIGGAVNSGNLHAPKLPFDPNYSLSSFTVQLVTSVDATSGTINDYISTVLNGVTLQSKVLERRLALILTARLF